VLGFLTGLYPVSFEGKIHYSGERARPTPRLPTSRRHARHYTHHSPAHYHTGSRAARTPTTAPNTPPHPSTPVAAPNTPHRPAKPDAVPTARPPPRAPHARRATSRYPPPLSAPVRPPTPTRCQPARAGHGRLAIAAARRAQRHRHPTRKVPAPRHGPPDASFRTRSTVRAHSRLTVVGWPKRPPAAPRTAHFDPKWDPPPERHPPPHSPASDNGARRPSCAAADAASAYSARDGRRRHTTAPLRQWPRRKPQRRRPRLPARKGPVAEAD